MPLTALLALAVLFLVLSTVAWASSVFALPGNWIVLLLALLFGWAEGFQAVRWWVLLAGALLAGLGEGVEFLSGYFGAKAFGGSRWAGVGALVGAVVGALLGATFGYGLGAIPGTVLGAVAGACIVEVARAREAEGAAMAGLGAGLGRALGLGTKLALGGAFLALLYVRVVWNLVTG